MIILMVYWYLVKTFIAINNTIGMSLVWMIFVSTNFILFPMLTGMESKSRELRIERLERGEEIKDDDQKETEVEENSERMRVG